MYNPGSTIRLQFNRNFTFTDFESSIPFFTRLGVKTIYASPIFKAVPGSLHGYDVTDPAQINPELGTEDQLRRIIKTLRDAGIGWIQDIVPNHMAFHPGNAWLMDVLEKGPASAFVSFFDTSLTGDFFHERIMLPILGESIDNAVTMGKIKLVDEGKFYFEYEGSRYPLNQPSTLLLTGGVGLANEHAALLREVLDMQFYRLCEWRETDATINYRRFFTVNGLICMNMNTAAVFEGYHRLVRTFVVDGLFNGLRVDHIDGLLDPVAYMGRLRQLGGPSLYIIIEKILEPGEKLEKSWPIEGTTGYDFLATVNNLFTWRRAESAFDKYYNDLTGKRRSFAQRVKEKKSLILFGSMAGELDNLCRYFIDLGLSAPNGLLRNTIASFLIHCPRYRFYGNSLPLDNEEEKMVSDVLDDCRNDSHLSTDVSLLYNAIVEKPRELDATYNRRALAFYQRLMQFTGPLMAKGVEDTLMYTFTRFIGHNEVGDSAEEFGLTTKAFHETMMDRQQHWPLALSATSTHDTKRGEDVRMRLNVLTDLADEWLSLADTLLNLDVDSSGSDLIDGSEKYFIYQTLAGAYPMDGDTKEFLSRLREYLIKAFREAKRHTDWNNPENAFENAVTSYTEALLSSTQFSVLFLPFSKKVVEFGIINSLSQLILKMTCPGVPDIYQASLLWDLSLVDPDNRRPVDFGRLLEYADTVLVPATTVDSLWQTRHDGRIKLWLTAALLKMRNEYVNLFAVGSYVPLNVVGRNRENVIAYCRQHQDERVVVVIALHLARKVETVEQLHLIDWSQTFVELDGHQWEWKEQLHGTAGTVHKQLRVADVFGTLPMAVVVLKKAITARRAGILMPVSSLPSSTAVGDLGPAARSFADFLFECGQKIWQMLPLTISDETVGFSPYSSYSSIAGNPLFISLDDLQAEGLLSTEDLRTNKRKPIRSTAYTTAREIKKQLLTKAWENYKDRRPAWMVGLFEEFVEKEAVWLQDFAVFELAYRLQKEPWTRWPRELKDRNEMALEDFRSAHRDELLQIMWTQFIFFRQAQALKTYCNDRGILLMGDLPFYVNHNSADVWVNRQLFDLDADGSMNGMAGVPPDYFNMEGQLWGMPVYNWNALRKSGYDWWVRRIEKSMAIFDLLRLDHFRAFAEYWNVPKGEKNAVNGSWLPGPGKDLFAIIERRLGKLQFVAEDLGDISQAVYQLRDDLALPGMKVLQFGFGDDFPASTHLPHNFPENCIAYTGTHDNNTSRGWYEKDLQDSGRDNLRDYLGADVKRRNVSSQLVRLLYGSVAQTIIIPMQDLMNLPARYRMNTPSTTDGNWTWRMSDLPDHALREALKHLVSTYMR